MDTSSTLSSAPENLVTALGLNLDFLTLDLTFRNMRLGLDFSVSFFLIPDDLARTDDLRQLVSTPLDQRPLSSVMTCFNLNKDTLS